MTIDERIALLEAYKFVIDEINQRIKTLEHRVVELTENEHDPNNPQYDKFRPKWIAEIELEIEALKHIIGPIEKLATQ